MRCKAAQVFEQRVCFRQGESAQKSAELGWKKGESGGSEVTGAQINSARVAEFLYMR